LTIAGEQDQRMFVGFSYTFGVHFLRTTNSTENEKLWLKKKPILEPDDWVS